MGGHGGLNILPQKSWNVYNQEAREKVVRDEKKHEEEQAAVRAKALQADRDFRRNLMLQRARGSTALGAPEEDPAGRIEGGRGGGAGAEGGAARGGVMVEAPQGGEGGLGRHVNLFQVEQTLAENPDNVREEKELRRTRGREDQQTSDARFDQGFALGVGAFGSQDRPWYAKAESSMEVREERTSLPARIRKEREAAEAGKRALLPPPPQAILALPAPGGVAGGGEGRRRRESSGSDSSGSSGGGRRKSQSKKKRRKEGKKEEKKKHKRGKDKGRGKDRGRERLAYGGAAGPSPGAASREALREERRRREEGERLRALRVMGGGGGGAPPPEVAERDRPFNSAFGFAPPPRR